MSKKESNQLLKHLEITLHDLHETIREHNKDYFADDGQEYPVPFIPTTRDKYSVYKTRDKYIAVREKNKPWVMKKNPNYKEKTNDNREKNKIRG